MDSMFEESSVPRSRTVCLYLAGPIDGIPVGEARGWRAEVAELNRGVLFFDPTMAWRGADVYSGGADVYSGGAHPGPYPAPDPAPWGADVDMARAVDAVNRAAIRHCDGLLVNLSGPGRGFGTAREIEYARSLGKPVSVFVGGRPLVSLLAHDLMVSSGCPEALGKLLRAVRAGRE